MDTKEVVKFVLYIWDCELYWEHPFVKEFDSYEDASEYVRKETRSGFANFDYQIVETFVQ